MEERPIVRMLYQHKNGKVFFLHGFAEAEDKEEVCLLTDVETSKSYTRNIKKFIGKDATFLLVKPK